MRSHGGVDDPGSEVGAPHRAGARERTQRFCELQDALGEANSATLSQRLKLLEDEGLIDRRAVSETPPWVEYSLTDKGADLRRAIAGIDRWADRWASQQ